MIDFDILNYEVDEMAKGKNNMDIILTYNIRKYYFNGANINRIDSVEKVRLSRNIKVKHKENLSIIKCRNCDLPMNTHDKECSYCCTKNVLIYTWQITEFFPNEK